jgi:hypothetical protein
VNDLLAWIHRLSQLLFVRLLAGFPRRITETRAALAAEALDALTKCLRHAYSDQTLTPLEKMFRSGLTIDHIHRLVDLEGALSKIILKSRVTPTQKEGESPFHTDDSFFPYERKLWYVL